MAATLWWPYYERDLRDLLMIEASALQQDEALSSMIREGVQVTRQIENNCGLVDRSTYYILQVLIFNSSSSYPPASLIQNIKFQGVT